MKLSIAVASLFVATSAVFDETKVAHIGNDYSDSLGRRRLQGDLGCQSSNSVETWEIKEPGCVGSQCAKVEATVKCIDGGAGLSVIIDWDKSDALGFYISSDDGVLNGSLDGTIVCGALFFIGVDCDQDMKYESKCQSPNGTFKFEFKFQGDRCGWFRRRSLRDGEEVPVKEAMSLPEVLEIIKKQKQFGASVDATFHKRYDLISKKSCNALVDYVEQSLASDLASGKPIKVGRASDGAEDMYDSWASFKDGGAVENQYNKKINADDLVKMIGAKEAKDIIDFFEESLGELTIDCMYLARHAEPKDRLYVVPWHTDDYATVEITLNDDYKGGDVLHLNGDGVHKTDAKPGSATAHNVDIVHGITPNIGGAKYMLILKHHYNRPDKVGVVRISKKMVDKIVGKSIIA